MDLTIPGGMGGKETVKKLLEINPQVKAIVSSGYSEDPIMTNYEQYGFAACSVSHITVRKYAEYCSKCWLRINRLLLTNCSRPLEKMKEICNHVNL